MISIQSLDFAYRAGEPVLRGLSAQFPLGQVHGIVGLNGAGKTTLFSLLGGLLPLQQGTVQNGTGKLGFSQVSFLPAENFFYPYCTGGDYLRLFGEAARIGEVNGLFGLPRDEFTDNYSTGMRKKLAVMGALLQDKPIVLLDEPFNGLDLESCGILSLIIGQLRQRGKTVLVSSHILGSLTEVCDRIYYLHGGCFERVVMPEEYSQFSQSIDASIRLRQEEAVNRAFGGSKF